ncbi:MAG: BON domain-containing protein [Candidatus Hydrogenedentes bacterium]|nr:BON domain-containing protein [Candidatus Hydrogenedentota bacterium]
MKTASLWMALALTAAMVPVCASAQNAGTVDEQVERSLDQATDAARNAREEVEDEIDDAHDAAEDAADAVEERQEAAKDAIDDAADDQIDWSQRVKDAATTARIETLFMVNDDLSAFNINTTTHGGVVTLEGFVDDPVARDQAEELARSVDDVRDVKNRLEVGVGDEGSGKDADDDTPRMGDRVRDANLAATVRNRIRSHDAIDGPVSVASRNGMISLSGTVGSEDEKTLAEDLASSTRGVRSVDNDLEVADADASADGEESWGDVISDEWTEKRVEQAIAFSRNLSIWDLDVEVDNGTCVLDGTVLSEEARALAEDMADNTRGVERVVNNIKVRAANQPS